MSLAALKFLHLQRHILFHGHEPLDTDSTPTLEGESWLMHNGFAQAEGVANLDRVPATGCLVEIGYPKFGGGLGGYARFIAICPPDWPHGVKIGQVPEEQYVVLQGAGTVLLHFERIGRCGQYLRQQSIGIKRNRRDQLCELLSWGCCGGCCWSC